LQVPDEPALLALEAELIAAGIAHHAIREPDAPHNGALMAIGILPQARANLRPLLGKLALMK
jgi:hypothetical protein